MWCELSNSETKRSLGQLPAQCFENVHEVVKHEDRLECGIAVSLGFVVQIQSQRRQNFSCKQTAHISTHFTLAA